MNIFLIGMMLSGKSTIGKNIASILNYKYIDTDTLIEEKTHLTINELIRQYGINEFRNIETDILKIIDLTSDNIISTGGGIVLNQQNVDYMNNHGLVIYLECSIDTLIKRLNNIEKAKRPLLLDNNIDEILAERRRFYEESCHHLINCDDLTIADITNKIINIINIT